MDGWNTMEYYFPFGAWPIFRGKLAVSFREDSFRKGIRILLTTWILCQVSGKLFHARHVLDVPGPRMLLLPTKIRPAKLAQY